MVMNNNEDWDSRAILVVCILLFFSVGIMQWFNQESQTKTDSSAFNIEASQAEFDTYSFDTELKPSIITTVFDESGKEFKRVTFTTGNNDEIVCEIPISDAYSIDREYKYKANIEYTYCKQYYDSIKNQVKQTYGYDVADISEILVKDKQGLVISNAEFMFDSYIISGVENIQDNAEAKIREKLGIENKKDEQGKSEDSDTGTGNKDNQDKADKHDDKEVIQEDKPNSALPDFDISLLTEVN